MSTESAVTQRRAYRYNLQARRMDRLKAEVKRHQSLGRDIGTMAIFMDLPVSKIRELIEAAKA